MKCTGTGLLALDIILNGSPETPPKISVGGSCGNVLTILSFLGWESCPISRISNNDIANLLLEDLKRWNVNTSLVNKDNTGSTPIIIHRILRNKQGKPIHKFEFRNPSNGKWLPSYKPVTWKMVNKISPEFPNTNVFYFDRINRGSIELAKIAKSQGALIVLEPSSIRNINHFNECLEIIHILKFSSERIKDFKKVHTNIPVPLVIETLGTEGLNYKYKSNNWKHISAFKIDNVVDAAGAGDWSTAGIINYLGLKGELSLENTSVFEIENAINYGQALGAINCFYDGARGLMYNMSLEALIKIISELDKKYSIEMNTLQINDNVSPNTLSNIEVLFSKI